MTWLRQPAALTSACRRGPRTRVQLLWKFPGRPGRGQLAWSWAAATLTMIKFQGVPEHEKNVFKACKLPQWRLVWSLGKLEIWSNLKPRNSLPKCCIKYFPYCKHALHLTMCKSYEVLIGDPARGGDNNKIPGLSQDFPGPTPLPRTFQAWFYFLLCTYCIHCPNKDPQNCCPPSEVLLFTVHLCAIDTRFNKCNLLTYVDHPKHVKSSSSFNNWSTNHWKRMSTTIRNAANFSCLGSRLGISLHSENHIQQPEIQ